MASSLTSEPVPPGIACSVISCVQRTAARALTIPQLEAVGLHPRVFLSPCEPADARGNAIVTRKAFLWAVWQHASLVFCEDDIDVHPIGFRQMLALAVGADRTTYLYTHDGSRAVTSQYTHEIRKALGAGFIEPGLYESQTRFLGGGQCVFIPYRVLAKLDLARYAGRRLPVDIYLSHQMDAMREHVMIALPHPVQHRHDRTVREPERAGQWKASMSYPFWASS